MTCLEALSLSNECSVNRMALLDAQSLARWSGGTWAGGEPTQAVQGVSIDTRTLQPGELFAALPGTRADGHRFIADAFERGALGALVQAGHATVNAKGGPLLVVDNPETSLRTLAAGLRAAHTATFIGITGSVGKTTIKELLAAMLEEQCPVARTPGNWNNALGLPLSLLRMKPAHGFGVFEVAMNRPGEIGPLADLLRPHCAVMAPIGPAHLEAFESVQGIAEEKAHLLSRLPPDGMAVLWKDDPWFDLLAASCTGRVRTVSLHPAAGADWVGRPEGRGALALLETETGEEVELICPVPGEFFQVDVLLAAAMARLLHVSWAGISRAVAQYEPVGMRWRMETEAGMVFVNDAYNANPISMAAALRTFGEMPVAGRRWLVLGTMRELGKESRSFHVALGQQAAAVPNAMLLVAGRWAEATAEGARLGGLPEDRLFVCSDVGAAAARLSAGTQSGDAVLLKASRGDALERVLAIWRKSGPERGPGTS